jgi:hypothetical protein
MNPSVAEELHCADHHTGQQPRVRTRVRSLGDLQCSIRIVVAVELGEILVRFPSVIGWVESRSYHFHVGHSQLPPRPLGLPEISTDAIVCLARFRFCALAVIGRLRGLRSWPRNDGNETPLLTGCLRSKLTVIARFLRDYVDI